ncbi:hypothetical protein A0J61_00238 [Choanephora cucurbitarum]|uniref:Protein JTB n=1 Tax=Choanephora cucurbitarum TaxID=101091 RepID=A0A1C7NRI7_9FUNG|nr:hypothetical protein A0J61_00238 [Choanephora cucurbitarum]
MFITLKALLLLCFISVSILAKDLDKRAPPFNVETESVSGSRHLGDYTHSHETVDKSTYSCYAIGECEVCSPFEKFIHIYIIKKSQPYCSEFGNKQAVKCEWDDPELADRKNQTSFYEHNAIFLPSFRACPRVKSVERVRMIEFEGLNIAVAVTSLLVFIWRQRRMAREQYERLAQRIGVTIV